MSSRQKAGQHKQGSIALIPFIFIAFLVGMANLLAAPVVYIYEIIQYNKKNEWPGWSVMDGLNYLFFEARPFFFFKQELYQDGAQVKYISFRNMPALTDAVNYVAYLYLDSPIVVIFLLNGIVLLTLSVRAAIFRLNRENT